MLKQIFSLTNEKKYSVDSATQKYLLYKKFVALSCDRCTVAPLMDYICNPVYQEFIEEQDYLKI